MTAAFPHGVMVAGIILTALLTAGAMVLGSERARAISMLGALALTPVLLVAEIWDSPQLQSLRDAPASATLLVGVAVAVVGALVLVLARRPAALALLTAGTVPFRVPIEAGGASANLLVGLYAVVAAAAIAWAIPRLARPSVSRPEDGELASWRSLEGLLAISLILYAVQSAYSSDASKALEQVVFFYVPFALLFVLLRDLEWTRALVKQALIVVAALALLFVAVGFVEYQQRELLLNPKVIASNQFESYFRVNSLFFDPNIYGRFLAIVMIGLAAVLLWERRPRTQWLVAGALAVLWAGLLLTLSQSSFVALLVGLAMLAGLRLGQPRRVLTGVVGVLVVAVLVIVAFPSIVRLDLESDTALDDATSGRYSLIAGGVDLARDRPVAGWGTGSYSREYRRHENTSSERAVSASHTIPVTVAAEQGLIGLAVYLALLAAALARLLRGATYSGTRAAVAAAFCALLVHTWLYAAFLEDPLTWVLLGFGVALARHPPQAPPEAEPAPS